MTKTQRILVVDGTLSDAEASQLSNEHECVAVFKGLPGFLRGQAEAEGWVLPHVFVEQWEEEEEVGGGGV